MGVGWVPELRKRTFPFIMQPINSRVVRRSNALYGNRYGGLRTPRMTGKASARPSISRAALRTAPPVASRTGFPCNPASCSSAVVAVSSQVVALWPHGSVGGTGQGRI